MNIINIPTELIHNNTTHRKRLIEPNAHHGDIATLNYAWLESGKQLEIHAHTDGEEFYYFISGMGKILIGDSWHLAKKGDFFVIPPQHLHSVKNTKKSNLVFLTIRTVQKNNV